MQNKTTHESFVLRQSTLPSAGIGVITLHDIAKGTYMELFRDGFEEEIRDESDVPKPLRAYCLYQGNGKILCPKMFNRMDIGNYLNHSENWNMVYEKGRGYFASRDIRAGEELFANYRDLGEPEDQREEYYKVH
ncbi:MAG: SET domain-containing protein [bacterium]|nr:SET domain-containing protein [bacterium]